MRSRSSPDVTRKRLPDGESVIVRGDEWRIAGSGGGGGGKAGGGNSKTPTEQADNLRSRSYASVLYLLCEGEIAGLANGLKGVYLNETPLQNTDGSFNFQNVAIDYRTGTQSQSYMPGFSNVESENQVGVKVTQQIGPIVRALNDVNADAISVRLMTPQLQQIKDNGDQVATSINFTIDISNNGGAYATYVNAAISGKKTSAYERSYRINLPKPGPWNIRVTRLTPDSSTNKIQNDLVWQSYTSIIETKLSYPNSAMFGIRISAEQFNSIPKLALDLKGLLVKIPSNYNPTTRTYTGIWNGSWGYAWTDNPAWVFYDLLTESRYGCGKNIAESQVDKWSLYAIAQYCDELVPNGRGGWEPRFTFNAYIQNAEEAYTVLNTLASVFRGMIYWANGTVYVTQDAPASPVRIFNETNVIVQYDKNGQLTSPPFTYSGASIQARHTVALVTWNDPNDFYRPKVEYVEDREAIARYGYRTTEVTAFGCTSRGQANRFGRWILYSEKSESETVTFTAATEGGLVSPGELIKVADPLRAGQRMGGRIFNATTTTITLDASVTIASGKTYTLSVLGTDGKQQERSVTNSAGSTSTITVSPAFSAAPVVGSPWVLAANDLQPQTFKVVTVGEKTPYQYVVTAVAHNPSKFAAVEQNLALQEIPITTLASASTPPNAPGSLTVTETLYESGAAGIRTRANIGFSGSTSPFLDRYQIEYRVYGDPGEYKILNYTSDTNYQWDDAQPGLYEIRVCAINKLGLRSDYVSTLRQISGLQTPPSDVNNFTLTRAGTQALLRWDPSTDPDVVKGGFFTIKFTPKTSSVTWADGIELPVVSGASSNAVVPLSLGTYMIKALDSSGNQSFNFTSVSSSFAIAQNTNIVATLQESPTFPGTRTNCTVNSGVLQLTSTSFFDSQPGLFDSTPGLFDSLSPDTFDSTAGLFDSQPGYFDNTNLITTLVLSGVYEFSNTYDLGAVYNCRISANISATVATNRSFFDSKEGLFDDAVGLFDGDSLTGASATLQIAISQDGSTWGAWSNFSIGDYVGRAFKFRVLLNSEDQNTNILVDQLSVTIDMPDRDEQGIATSTGSLQTVNFTKAYWTASTPVIGVTLIGANNGDYFVITPGSINNTGFQIQVFNASGVGISGRQFNWLARGYGQAG